MKFVLDITLPQIVRLAQNICIMPENFSRLLCQTLTLRYDNVEVQLRFSLLITIFQQCKSRKRHYNNKRERLSN